MARDRARHGRRLEAPKNEKGRTGEQRNIHCARHPAAVKHREGGDARFFTGANAYHSANWMQFVTRFRCVSITPFEGPVVPPV